MTEPALEPTDREEALLDAMQSLWDLHKPDDDNPFSNSGAEYVSERFSVFAYNWSDDDQPFNLSWRDFRVSWYKYQGRSTRVSRHLANNELVAIMAEYLAEISTPKTGDRNGDKPADKKG